MPAFQLLWGSKSRRFNRLPELVELVPEFRALTGVSGDEYGALPLSTRDDRGASRCAGRVPGAAGRDRPIGAGPSPNRFDFHLVRAEMNGLGISPSSHAALVPRSGTLQRHRLTFIGEFARDAGRTTNPGGCRRARRSSGIRTILEAWPDFFSQARINLADRDAIPGDLALLRLGICAMEMRTLPQCSPKRLQYVHNFAMRSTLPVRRPPNSWPGGVECGSNGRARGSRGRENYDWLLKNVYLFPYSWDQLSTIVELEDNRVITFQQLEANRNRALPDIQPVQSQEEYRQSVAAAIDDLMSFIRDENIFSMPDYLTPDDYFGSWHGFDNPWPQTHDYFFNFSHREPRMEEAHEMVGHHFDALRGQHDTHPIRQGWRPYKIATARTEGFAFALEELLMHAGYLDHRTPRAREIAYEQAAFRTVRALSDIYMHDNQWSLRDAMAFSVANAPHGELLDDSPHLWFEMATTLRGVGHHMLMVVGKVQFMKLLRDRSQQLGDDFELQAFMDEFFESGLIPISLIRWEMTGRDDEMRTLLQ